VSLLIPTVLLDVQRTRICCQSQASWWRIRMPTSNGIWSASLMLPLDRRRAPQGPDPCAQIHGLMRPMRLWDPWDYETREPATVVPKCPPKLAITDLATTGDRW